jgi:hypothetical protein
MPPGRPKRADPGTLYALASLFYWDFKRIVEGFVRQRFDRSRYKSLYDDLEKRKLRLMPAQLAELEKRAAEEIQNGRLKESEKLKWIQRGKKSWLLMIREDCRQRALDEAAKLLRVIRVKGEPEIIKELLEAETADRVREICQDAFVTVNSEVAPNTFKEIAVPNWPLSVGSVLPSYLSQYASEFIAARRDSRFPRSSDRPTSQLKQLWFLSRALAGAAYEVKVRTAINLVGSMRPDEMFEDTHGAKPTRRRSRVTVRNAKNPTTK